MDKYGEQIQRLTEDPSLIHKEWARSIGLFQFASPDGFPSVSDDGKETGCLTMIKGVRLSNGENCYAAQTPELTLMILNDPNIPTKSGYITPENLWVFAEYQRLIDDEVRNNPKYALATNNRA